MERDKFQVEKLQFALTQPEMSFNLKRDYNVMASRLNWLTYVTASSGNNILTIQISELGDAGYFYTDTNGANKKYYASIPLDPSPQVTNIYANFTGPYDKTYDIPKEINQLSFKVLINGVLANDVTALNPIQLELVFNK